MSALIRRSQSLLLLGALLAFQVSLFAQSSGRISGVLRDATGAVIAGARIDIANLDSGLTASVVTDRQGQYVIDALPAGRYSVAAVSPGFEKASREQVAVAPGAGAVVDLTLVVAGTKSVVEVTAPAVAVASEAITPQRARTNDTASLLRDTPGLAIYGSGGVSGLPVIHGMADDRVNVLINGMSIAQACSNHMNPPMSYIDPSNVGGIRVIAGITPVSDGGDSIAGTIAIDSAAPEFAGRGQGIVSHGGISMFHRTNGVVNGGNAWISAASENLRIGYSGAYVNANNYRNGAGVMVKSTFYESRNHALQLAARRGSHLVTLDLGYQHIPQQGFVNARMDMVGNEAKFLNLHYDAAFSRWRLEARAYYELTRHAMNILRDKVPGMNMPMDTRGANLGYSVKAEVPLSGRDVLRVGSEFRRFALDDWWTPVTSKVGSMGPETLWNMRDGRLNRFGAYVEWETKRGNRWTELLGVRTDLVRMNAGNVAGYNMSPTTTGSAAYYADAVEFNARDHRRQDNNLDVTALTRYEPRPNSAFEFGYARKTRSPNLYERYIWVKRSSMSANMNGWFGDGNGYTGNLDLKPEIAHTVSASAAWRDAKQGREIRITPYYTRVQHYIDVDRCRVIVDGSNGCTAAKFAATSGFVTLQFANHAARLYGMDVSGRLPLYSEAKFGSLALSGVAGYVRGRNLDTGDALYQIMPLNGKLTLEHQRGGWSGAFDFQAVDAKKNVQAVRNELTTPGYALLDVRGAYEWRVTEKTSVRLDAGIDNLANRNYVLPLGGRYWIGDKTGNSPVPAMGRNVYSALTFQF